MNTTVFLSGPPRPDIPKQTFQGFKGPCASEDSPRGPPSSSHALFDRGVPAKLHLRRRAPSLRVRSYPLQLDGPAVTLGRIADNDKMAQRRRLGESLTANALSQHMLRVVAFKHQVLYSHPVRKSRRRKEECGLKQRPKQRPNIAAGHERTMCLLQNSDCV